MTSVVLVVGEGLDEARVRVASDVLVPTLQPSIRIAEFEKSKTALRRLGCFSFLKPKDAESEKQLQRLVAYLAKGKKAAVLGHAYLMPIDYAPSGAYCAYAASDPVMSTRELFVDGSHFATVEGLGLPSSVGQVLKCEAVSDSHPGKLAEDPRIAFVVLEGSDKVAKFADDELFRKQRAFVVKHTDGRESVWLVGIQYPNGAPCQLELWYRRECQEAVKTDQDVAANFYDTLKRTDRTGEATRIFHLRRLNNWIKSELIGADKRPEKITVLDLACGKGGDLAKWASHKLERYIGVDIAKQSLEEAMDRMGGGHQRRMKGFPANLPTKFIRADLGAASLFSDDRVEPTANFDVHSGLTEEWLPTQREPPLSGLEGSFGVISMQFALHYMFQSSRRADLFFGDIGRALSSTGRFVATTVDAQKLASLLMTRATQTRESPNKKSTTTGLWWRCDIDDETGEDAVAGLRGVEEARLERASRRILTIWCEDDVRNRLVLAREEDEASLFGLRYWFQLRDGDDALAVDSPEWLVPLPLLNKIAARHGLVVERAERFDAMVDRRRTEMGQHGFYESLERMRVPDHQGTLSPGEWEVANLYTTLTLKRLPPPPPPMAMGDPPTGPAEARNMVKLAWGERYESLDARTKTDLMKKCLGNFTEGAWRPPT